MKFTGRGGWWESFRLTLALATFLQSILYLIDAREPFRSALNNAAIVRPIESHSGTLETLLAWPYQSREETRGGV